MTIRKRRRIWSSEKEKKRQEKSKEKKKEKRGTKNLFKKKTKQYQETHETIRRRTQYQQKFNTRKNCGHITFSEHSQCHVMTKKLTIKGYARITLSGYELECVLAHEIACSVRQKRLRVGEEVTRHLCREKACVNPEHFLFGTQAENARDSWNIKREDAEVAKSLYRLETQN